MIRRILDIIVFPFYLIFLIFSLPLKILWIVINDRKDKSGRGRRKSRQIMDEKSILAKGGELLEVGKLLFSEHKAEFEKFFNAFLTDKREFIYENQELLQEHWAFELERLRAIEVIYVYGASVGLLKITDWKGEENIGEIEEFLDTELQINPDWTHVRTLRGEVEEEKQRNGDFIKDLFRTIDTDLKSLNKRLIFLELGWDAYVYTAVAEPTFKRRIGSLGTLFHGTDIL